MIGIFINLWNRLTGGGSAPAPALLDTYGGAAAAFSLRKLSSTYGGSAVRVRRSLDNTEQDIGFSGDNLDETALQAFVGYENLLTYSEQFENASWTKNTSTITPNAGADPLGGNNAERWLSNVGSTTHYLSQNIALTSGQSYTISFYVKSNTGSDQQFRLFGSGGTTLVSQNLTANSSWQRFTYTFVADTATAIAQGISRPSTNTAVDLLIFGAQLNQGVTAQNYQQTIASANTANGFVTKWYTQDGNGENLLLQSQTFENIYWSKDNVNVTANSVNAPDGTLTADKLYDDTTNSIKVIYRQNITAAGPVIQSVYMKAAEYNFGLIQLYEGNAPTAQRRFSVLFNLSNGTVETTFSVNGGTGTYGIEAAGNGWYRCWVAWTVTLATGGTAHIALSNSGTPATWTFGFPQYLGNGSSGIYIWGAQLSQSSWLQGYQATTTTTVSRRDASQATAASQPRIVNAGVIERENGKPSIRFDGVDDNLLNTNTIPTTTSLSVFATFRKISHVNNAGIFTLRPSLISPNDRDWASSNGRSFAAGVTPNGFQFIAHFIFSGSDGFSDPIDIKPNIALGSLISTSIFETGGLASAYTNGSVLLIDTYNGTPTAPTGIVIGARYDSAVNQFGNVSIPDLILYPTNLLPSRLAIESNVGSYYQTQWIGTQQALLDQFGGSAAAFSLRNLSSSYRGPLVRVRRSSDNAETDIGGTFSGDLDVNSLLAFTGGQNLLAYSQDYTQVTWNKLGVVAVASATFAPDGTLTAQKINETAGGTFHILYTDITTSGTPMTYSFYAKAAERNTISVQCNNITTSSTVTVLVDLSTGLSSVITGVSGVYISHSVVNVGNGWWRIAVSGSTGSASSHRYQTVFLNNGQASYAGVAGSGVYVWGAQLTTGSVLQPYIPTTTAAINGANAFVTKWYDQSGIGDNLLLQSETFGNASWTKNQCTVSDNVSLDPFGGNNADKILENGLTAQNPYAQQIGLSLVAGTTYVASCYVKAAERNFCFVDLNFAGTDYAQLIDLTTGSAVANLNNPSYVVENAGNGWWRLAIFITPTTNGAASVVIGPKLTAAFGTYNTTANSGILIYGAQISASSQLLRYQPTTTAIAPKRDAIQTTAASQPRIVNAGSVESENGKPALFWTDGSGMRLVSSFSPIALPQSFFAVSKVAAVSGIAAAMVFDSYDNIPNAYYFTGSTDSPFNALRYISDGSLIIDASPIVEQSLVSILHNTTTNVYYDGRFSASGNAGTSTLSGLSIGQIRGNPNPIVATPYDMFGSIQELTIYPTNQSLRASVESNINTYYQIYWQGNGTALLDSFSGASAAYSLRNLSSAYTGPLIRVRRSSDNAERDIYGTFRGDLDLAALTSFVGANSGFVTTWYDQSGTGRHATQATASRQPRIVNAGAVDTQNGKPVIDFATTQDIGFATPLNFSEVDSSFFMTIRRSTAGNDSVLISSVSNDYLWLNYGGTQYYGGTTVINTNLSAANQYMIAAATMDYGVALKWYRNGVLETTKTTGFVGGQAFNTILFTTYRASVVQTSELIVFPTNQDSSAVNIQSNINNYYKIY